MYDASQGAQLIAHEGTHSVMLRGPGVNFNRVQHESLAYHVQARTAFERRVARLAARLAEHVDPDREPGHALAPRLRDWAGEP